MGPNRVEGVVPSEGGDFSDVGGAEAERRATVARWLQALRVYE